MQQMQTAAPALGTITPIPVQFHEQISPPRPPAAASLLTCTSHVPADRCGPIPNIHTPSWAAWLHAHLTPQQRNPGQPQVQNSPSPIFLICTDSSACPEFIFHTNKELEETPQPHSVRHFSTEPPILSKRKTCTESLGFSSGLNKASSSKVSQH